MKVCFYWDGDSTTYPVILEQNGPQDFTVRYGKQTKLGLDYADAATALGAAIMHALVYNGELDIDEA